MSSISKTLKSSLLRAIRPDELVTFIKLQRNRKKNIKNRVRRDPQLELYSRMLRRDFLHYGYFLDPNTPVESISLADIENAQLEYAKLFLKQLPDLDQSRPILDIGCGMGGLSALLKDEGFQPIALSPDEHQIRYIEEKYPEIPTLHCKFEEIDLQKNLSRYGVIITSESLQYLNLKESFPILEKILIPNGKWLICDYFRKEQNAFEKSGHLLETFLSEAKARGWSLEHTQDVTPHILVTLKYLSFLSERMLLPLLDFGLGKLQVKQPGWAHLFRDFLPELKQSVTHGLKTIDPEHFARDKTYRFMVLRKSTQST